MNLQLIKSLFFIIILTLSNNLYSDYNSETIILHHSTGKHGSVWVYEYDTTIRCLSFIPPHNIIQSCMTSDDPNKLLYDYSKMVFGGLYLNKYPKNILMIGLGGATIPKALNVLLPFAKLDIVEINGDLAEIAQKYFAFQPNDNTNIFIEDGFSFVKRTKAESYDLIIVDVFDNDYIPPPFLTLEFVKNINTF